MECGCGAIGASCATCSACAGSPVGRLMVNDGPLLEDPTALGGVGAPLTAAPLTPSPMTTLPGVPQQPGMIGQPPLQPTLPVAPTPSLVQPPLAPPVPAEASSRRRLTSR